MKILILGPPGCGKGTQSQMISSEYGLSHISTGDMLRDICTSTPIAHTSTAFQSNEQSETLARRIRSYIDVGHFIPDSLMIELLQGQLSEKYILDGFPRTLKQAKMIKDIDIALFINVDEDTCVQRIVNRKEGRPDDNEATARVRYETYIKKTLPVVEYLRCQHLLVEINGMQTKEEVFRDIKHALDDLMKK